MKPAFICLYKAFCHFQFSSALVVKENFCRPGAEFIHNFDCLWYILHFFVLIVFLVFFVLVLRTYFGIQRTEHKHRYNIKTFNFFLQNCDALFVYLAGIFNWSAGKAYWVSFFNSNLWIFKRKEFWWILTMREFFLFGNYMNWTVKILWKNFFCTKFTSFLTIQESDVLVLCLLTTRREILVLHRFLRLKKEYCNSISFFSYYNFAHCRKTFFLFYHLPTLFNVDFCFRKLNTSESLVCNRVFNLKKVVIAGKIHGEDVIIRIVEFQNTNLSYFSKLPNPPSSTSRPPLPIPLYCLSNSLRT